MIGRGERRIGVEVTTFRGEGAYSDARRPDTVTFGVPLVEDLARRDLVVNAIAYDPIRDELHDPFGGREDLEAKRLRAVGDPVARFTEDGLRVMRAVRFAATLEFALDPETEAAFGPALPSLAKVSQERVKVELWKLLAARVPSSGLVIARRSGVLGVVLPEVADSSDFGAVDAAPDVLVRMAALLAGAGVDVKQAEAAMRRLKTANDEREVVVRLMRVANAAPATTGDLRRELRGVGRANGESAAALWEARGNGALAAAARLVLANRDPLTIGELAIGGEDLKQIGMAPGKQMGQTLERLLEAVLDDPSLNTREQLLERAQSGSK
jgi:tRNA nucleotidyltransferase (CCA-adding enzyme)